LLEIGNRLVAQAPKERNCYETHTVRLKRTQSGPSIFPGTDVGGFHIPPLSDWHWVRSRALDTEFDADSGGKQKRRSWLRLW
jgi:hypothetical protein